MTTIVGDIDIRATKEEVVTMRIARVDAEVPVTAVPVKRTIEIGCVNIGAVLPVKQHIAQVEITLTPIDTIEVIIRVDAHQVIEIDLVGSLILRIRQVELVSHLVGQEQSLLACLLITPGRCLNSHDQEGDKSQN